MDAFQIFGLQATWSYVTYGSLAAWYIWPVLRSRPAPQALQPLIALHLVRSVGFTTLVPIVADPQIPKAFTIPQAYGDMAAAVLAMVTLVALRRRARIAIPLAWTFNVVGLVDLFVANYQAVTLEVWRYQLGSTWYQGTFLVPALVVSHILAFLILLRGGTH
jgi:hypothetical protein